MNRFINFIKKEPVLSAAWVLAAFSALLVRPDEKYPGYIDFRSLGILWSLMVIMAGFRAEGVFDRIGRALLARTRYVWQLAAVLVYLCFFLSMFITNDVALITFVPFSVFVLCECGRKELLIPVIVLQTLAANLGSMLTPVGNPQNLYLYGLSGMGFAEFIMLMLPYSALTFVMLAVSLLFIKGKSEPVSAAAGSGSSDAGDPGGKSSLRICIYAALFIAALLVVARLIPYTMLVAAVFVAVLIISRKTLLAADYMLLLTFVGFFIFTGNIGRLPAVVDTLTVLISGNETLMGITASQLISNVPAALLLSAFTENYRSLIIGVNLGGLGTLIASMASLISFKLYAACEGSSKGKYFAAFTVMNLIYLAVLAAFHAAISGL